VLEEIVRSSPSTLLRGDRKQVETVYLSRSSNLISKKYSSARNYTEMNAIIKIDLVGFRE
jgi:hypothetical protein